MTTPIQSMTPAVSALAIEEVDGSGLITADNVLAYCAARLNTLDEMIKARFAEQQRRNHGMKLINKAVEILNRNPNGQMAGAHGHEPFHIQQGKDLCALYNETTDPEIKKTIGQAYTMVMGGDITAVVDPKTGLADPAKVTEAMLVRGNIKGGDAAEWARRVNDYKGVQDSLSKDNELSMIQLQAIISQRQLAVQLTTQMMAAMHDATKGIVANIRA
jgi:hypothetical protein